MLGWLKRGQIAHRKRLLWQNKVAAERVRFYFENKGDQKTISKLDVFVQANDRVTEAFFDKAGKLAVPEVQVILEINRDLRRLFEEAEIKGPQARVHQITGGAFKPRRFDDVMKPPAGWHTV